MKTVIRHIEYLLTEHNCVIIPQLGAVLASRCGARILPDGSVMPPRRVYTFNASLTQSDGMLEKSVERALGISYARACDVVAESVQEMRRALENGQVSIGRIGTLTCDADTHTVHFQAAESDMLTPAASWFRPIAAQTQPVAEDIAAQEEATGARGKLRVGLRRFARVAAAVAACIAIAIVASTPITVDNSYLANIAMPAVSAPRHAAAPAKPKAPRTLKAVEAVEPQVVKVQTQKAPATVAQSAPEAPVQPEAVVKDTPKPKPAAAAATRLSEADDFCVVVASLPTEEGANQTVATLKRRYGGNYGILLQGGRYRVYAATATTRAEAQQARRALSQFDGAWVCAR